MYNVSVRHELFTRDASGVTALYSNQRSALAQTIYSVPSGTPGYLVCSLVAIASFFAPCGGDTDGSSSLGGRRYGNLARPQRTEQLHHIVVQPTNTPERELMEYGAFVALIIVMPKVLAIMIRPGIIIPTRERKKRV